MHEALRHYCAVFHPEIKQVSTLPLWLVKLLATLTRNQELKSAGESLFRQGRGRDQGGKH